MGKAKEAALNISIEDLNQGNGLDVFISMVDKIYLRETINSYKHFDSFRRSENMNMHEYIAEFDQWYTRNTKYKMLLTDAVLAFKVLDNSNLNE